MKNFGVWAVFGFLFFSMGINAQNSEMTEAEKLSYYEQRAKEDATYEQSFTADDPEDEEDFWEDQKTYERNLKKRDKKAYKAYMKGKRAAYAEHEAHCDNHCHHSEHYHYHASFYYHDHNNYYRSYPSRTTIGAGVRIGAPRVRIGL